MTWWIYLLSNGAVQAPDWQPSERPLQLWFAGVGAFLCVAAWMMRRARPNVAARDHKSAWEVLLDFVLAVPRLTLSVFGTATARVRLDEEQLALAWNLLRRMREAGKPMPLYEVPLELPEEERRERVLLALQLSELIEVRRSKDGGVLAFCNEGARKMAEERVRLR